MTIFLRALEAAVAPRSAKEDVARREFILNVLLFGVLSLLFIGILLNIGNIFFSDPTAHQEGSLPLVVMMGIFGFFFVLYVLSRKGLVLLSSYLLISVFFGLAVYMEYRWGVNLPAAILFYALTIAMSGVLINSRFAFMTTVAICISIITIGSLQHLGEIPINRYWTKKQWGPTDMAFACILLLVIATVSWLSNREIEKSLKRARRSEAELKQERDQLEVRVEERTRELRQAEMERMSQAYHFVEFGRIAGGVFHDLMSPLAALSLNIDRIADAPSTRQTLAGDARRAKSAAAHMQSLLLSMRKRLAREGSEEVFSVREALKETMQVLTSYARANHVRCALSASEDVRTYGDPVAFSQVLTNLVGNAIQAYPPREKGQTAPREVAVSLAVEDGYVRIAVRDHGAGIAEDVLPHIFEPFFTTKDTVHGIGLGLSLAKRIVEKDFNGTLSVDSRAGEGSTFTIYFPVREP